MNDDDDDDTNVEPVDLSPTRAELIARVRARGRRIRARRRLLLTGLTALVVLAIAVPAVAIGTRSSPDGVTPATVVRAKRDFEIAVINDPPAASSTNPIPPPCPSGLILLPALGRCFVLGPALVTASDVRSDSVVYDTTQGWIVNVEIASDAVIRLAAQANEQAAIIVGGRVVSAPVVNPGITGTTVTISGAMTRAQAIVLATAILGGPPTSVAAPPALTATIKPPTAPFVSGLSTNVTLVIVNHTAHAIKLTDRVGCPVEWRATLTPVNGPITTSLGARNRGTTCPTASPIAPGTNRIQVTVSAVALCYSPAGTLPGVPACLPNGEGPPIAPGAYQLEVSGNSTAAPLPAPVRVEVVAAAAR